MTLPWRRGDDAAPQPDADDPGVGADDWADGWDDDWDDAPWGDPGEEPGDEDPESWRARLEAPLGKAREIMTEVPLGVWVALGVLLVLGVVLGPQTGEAITDLTSPSGDESPSDVGPVDDASSGEPAVGADRPDVPVRPTVDAARPPGAPQLPDGSGLTVLAAATVAERPAVTVDYDRDAFPHWTDPDGNGCDARQDTLIRDFGDANVEECVVIAGSGTLLSVWDRAAVTDPTDADVDHVVALGWAHAAGAADWAADDPRREQLANDPANLVAVTASSNRAKGALGPDEWQPDDPTAACLYANRFIRIVVGYDLTLTESERAALEAVLSGCE